jgi:catalase
MTDHLTDQLTDRRPVTAAGAYGVFEAMEDVSQYTKAGLFVKGTVTRLIARFSTVTGELGGAGTVRDPRGFAIKFYTDRGSYDLVGSNTPVFFIRDPEHRAVGPLRGSNAQWDFWTLRPESAHQVTILMTDRGIPASWRHLNGYGGHTFMWYNAGDEKFWVKYHIKTDQGIQNLSYEDARMIAARDPDHHTRDLYRAIAGGDFPSWTVQVQVMPFADAAGYRFNPFDLTKVWPHEDYPPITIGRIRLDRNPVNYFAEIEQSAFEPANLVPGIGPSPDKMLQGRLFSHPDTHRYRIGPNFLQLPADKPRVTAQPAASGGGHAYGGPAGAATGLSAGAAGPGARPGAGPGAGSGFEPGSGGHLAPDPGLWRGEQYQVTSEIMRTAYTLHRDDDDFAQPRALVETVLSGADRDRLVASIASHVRDGVSADLLPRVIGYWTSVSPALGARVAQLVAGAEPG